MANQHIKGLTVEIGGNTTELTAALKDVDGAAKKSSDELKSVNAALKLDPTNTTLVAQKQEVLASSIETAKKKLEILKKAEQDAQSQFEKGDISAEQYRALQREVIYAENKLKKLETQFEDTNKAASDAGTAIDKSGEKAEDAAKDNAKLEKSLDDIEKKYDEAKDAASDAGKEIAATAAVAAAAVGASVAAAMSYDDALDSIQLQTGANAEQMVLYEKAMKAVFASGLGEDLDDVANTMAVIAQQTNETDPSKLQAMAENALILKDGFGFETAEQMRAVNMLTTQFGISADQAYALIVQGAQKGLNKNGDLLDVINEYSVHYKNLGYDQDDFFNSLANGAETGVFSVDKLGDAMKEFGIKVKDESTSTTEAYESLNLDAEEMRKKFSEGGQSAQEAAQIVNDALFSMDDEVAQNTIGVALYGTMWEDMGKDAIQAIGNVNGEITATSDAMEEVRAVKMESTSTKWAALGRTVQTDLLIPLGEKLLPTVKKLADLAIKNADKLIPMVKSLATIMISMWSGMKIGQAVAAIGKAVAAYKTLKQATTTANAAMAATPWGAIGAAVGLVVGGIVSLVSAEHDAAEAAREQTEARKAQLANLRVIAAETAEEYQKMADAAFESSRAQRDAAEIIDDEYDTYQDLWKELQGLVDAQGNVKKGNEERVEQIYGELQEAVGFENSLVDGQIEKYQELAETIRDMIEMRRAQAYLDRAESDYEQAKSNLPSLQLEYEAANEVAQKYRADWSTYIRLQEELAAIEARDYSYYKSGPLSAFEIGEFEKQKQAEYDAKAAELASYEDWYTENANAIENLKNAQTAYDAARNTVSEYETLEEAVLSEVPEQIASAYASATDGMMTHASGISQQTLDAQVQEYLNAYQELLKYSQVEGSSVSKAQLDEAARLVLTSIYESMQSDPTTGRVNPGSWQENSAIIRFLGYDNNLPYDVASLYSLEEFLSMFEPTVPGVNSAYRGGDLNSRYAPFSDSTMLSPWELYSKYAGDQAISSLGGLAQAMDGGIFKRQNSLLESILQRIDELELTFNIDGEELVSKTIGRTDRALGQKSKNGRRGSLSD